MEEERYFIGNIKKCTKLEAHKTFEMVTEGITDSFGYMEIEDELYKENAILLKTKEGYIDLDNLTTLYNIKKNRNKKNILMPTYPIYIGCLFIDEKSLKPYESDIKKSTKAIKKVIK